MMRRFLVSLALAAACAQLPPEWGSAAVAENFTQSECVGNLAELESRGGERVAIREAGDGRLRIEVRNAHFRCEQRVTGYVRTNGSAVDVLVQPADMNPSSVAKCDCLYDLTLDTPRLAPGTYDVTVHRRRDNRNSPNEPVRIGGDRLTVR